MDKVYDLIVVGGGPAGYTTALYGARAGLDVVVLEKLSVGGQMALTHMIDNYPGYDEGIDGFDLGQKMRQGAARFGAATKMVQVLSAQLDAKVKAVHTDSGVFYGRAVVIATGAEPRKLGLPNEDALTGQGVHYCAACDGMFYRGKTVVLVGGGNSAAAEALVLSRVAKKVILIHRRDSLRAEKAASQAVERAENIEIRWNSQVIELLHDGKIRGVRLQDVTSGDQSEIHCDGVFISIGRVPATSLVKGQLTLDDAGYIVAGEDTKTNLSGVFAAGDVRTKAVRQIVTATADGASAAYAVERYLAGH
ncbi:MAG: thioredoxin-disulfide reductase [Oscillospiraceae bacterium]|nr:thioredoxin-disulfide reductase [Oscillospiraceae bacterium]